MAGEKNISSIVRVAHWPAYKARHGLEVVRMEWPRGAPMPIVLCRPLTPGAARVATAPASSSEQPPFEQQEE